MSSKKILIIDDEPDVVTYLSAVLEANGYESFATGNIKTAMEQVKDIHPDLICLDIVMPQETGISFYTRLRQDKELKTIPVIIISGIVELSKSDMEAIKFVIDEFGKLVGDYYKLARLTHAYPEWNKYETYLQKNPDKRKRMNYADFLDNTDPKNKELRKYKFKDPFPPISNDDKAQLLEEITELNLAIA